MCLILQSITTRGQKVSKHTQSNAFKILILYACSFYTKHLLLFKNVPLWYRQLAEALSICYQCFKLFQLFLW